MQQAGRLSLMFLMGLAPLQGSRAPFVKKILLELFKSLSVLPPKKFRVKSQSGTMPQVWLQQEVQASKSNGQLQNISLVPDMLKGIAQSAQASTSHPDMSWSLELSSYISLHLDPLKLQQYYTDLRIAEKRAESLDEGLTESSGTQEELAGQAGRFFRKLVGQGQLSIAMYVYPLLMQFIKYSMSLLVFSGLHKLKYEVNILIGADGLLQQARSLLNPSLITQGQLGLCIWKFLVTIWQKTLQSSPFLFLKQKMGADAP